MRTVLKKLLAVILLLALILCLFQLDFRKLVDFRQLVAVMLGGGLLTLVSFSGWRRQGKSGVSYESGSGESDKIGERRLSGETRGCGAGHNSEGLRHLFADMGRNCLYAGIVTSLVLIFSLYGGTDIASSGLAEGNIVLLMLEFLLCNLRPVLYGYLMLLLFLETNRAERCDAEKQGAEKCVVEKQDAEKPVQEKLEPENEIAGQILVPSAAGTVTEPDLSLLSRRELEVARLAARGCSNAEISEELFISVETVKRHMSTIFGKLGISSRKELQAWKDMF